MKVWHLYRRVPDRKAPHRLTLCGLERKPGRMTAWTFERRPGRLRVPSEMRCPVCVGVQADIDMARAS